MLELKKLINNSEAELTPMIPWYRGFKGVIELISEHKYICTGVWNRINPTTIEVSELPIGKSTQSYKEFLDSLVESNEIIDYKNNCDDKIVNFKVIMQKTVIDSFKTDDLIKKLKLTSTINTGNMHVFDETCKIRKVNSPEEIIYRFFMVRKKHYTKRKDFIIETINKDLSLLESKIRFIKADPIIVKNKISVSFNETARVFDFKILQQEINCKQESSVYNLILPTLLLLSLIIYVFIFRIKYIV
jgi:DNA topoisomerase-2